MLAVRTNRRCMLMAGALVALAGCEAKLETGYDYRPLSASPAERRAYYAAPFSPESKVSEDQRGDELRPRRPTSY